MVLHAIQKDKWASTDLHTMQTFLLQMRRYIEQVNPRYYLFELPQMAEVYLSDTIPYTLVQYADYGIPQSRIRLLLGNMPLPTPQFDIDTWRIHPEIGTIAPTMGVQEYYYSKENTRRGNRAFGRRLWVADMMDLYGYTADYIPPGDLRVKRNMDLMNRTVPPLFSAALGSAVREALATG